MWAVVSEAKPKKLQKALEHLWFGLVLQRKSCSPVDRDAGERCVSRTISIARAGIQHVVEVMQAVMMGTTRNSNYDKKKV